MIYTESWANRLGNWMRPITEVYVVGCRCGTKLTVPVTVRDLAEQGAVNAGWQINPNGDARCPTCVRRGKRW